MIDTWLFAALVLGIVAVFTLMRGIPSRSRDDRLVAASVAVTAVSMAALALSIALGMVVILDLAILLSICCFGILIWYGRGAGDPA